MHDQGQGKQGLGFKRQGFSNLEVFALEGFACKV